MGTGVSRLRLPIFLLLLVAIVCAADPLPPKPPFQEFTKWLKDAKEKDPLFSGSSLNPIIHPNKWVALGDSFAAGPGAGDTIDDEHPNCMRGKEAYAFQMQRSVYMPGPNEGSKPEFTFKACTGDVTTDLTEPLNPNYQLAVISDHVNFVTLSIGGNDVLFSTILKKCVYGVPPLGDSCDDSLKNARKLLYSQEFNSNYNKVLKTILEKMRWEQRRDDWHTAIYQTGYSQFFDAHTDQCDKVGFFLTEDLGPRITKELRIKLNRLAHEVNYVTQYWVDLYNTPNTKQTRWNRYTTPINYVNVDWTYNGHRFCRDGVKEPDYQTPDTHFFHFLAPAKATQNETLAEIDMYDNPKANAPVRVTKTFHPTPGGFEHTSDHVLFRLNYLAATRYAAGAVRKFKLMVMGDYVAYANQDPNSDIFQGFIPHLNALLRSYAYYGYPWGDGAALPKLHPIFIGSRQPINGNGKRHECYQSATIDRLIGEYRRSADRRSQGKTIILMTGTHDLLYGIDLENAPDRVNRLLDAIFKDDRDATVLLTHIPMIGLAPDADGTKWYDLSKHIVEYNARLSALANYYITTGKGKVLVVHTSATPLEHLPGDPLLPSREGYQRMAHNFAEAIVEAAAAGFIVSTDDNEEDLSKDGGDYANVEQEKTQCAAFRGFTTGQPKKEEIRDAWLQGMKIEEFIEKIACNKTEVCKTGVDGFHGDPGQPSGLSLNATDCFRAGGKFGKPDYNQLNISMPTTNYELGKSQCGKVIKSIMDDCIMSDRASGGYWKGKDGLFIKMAPIRVIGNANEPQNITAEFYDNNAVVDLLRNGKEMPLPAWGIDGNIGGSPMPTTTEAPIPTVPV